MTILSPVQRQRRGCTVFLLFILAVLVLVGVSAYALYSFYPRGNASSTSTPVGIGITIAPDGEQIGISDGTYAFDTNRSDGSLKIKPQTHLKKEISLVLSRSGTGDCERYERCRSPHLSGESARPRFW